MSGPYGSPSPSTEPRPGQDPTRLDAEDEISERARRLLESNVIGAMVEGPDDDILYANDAFLEIVGYSREDLEAGGLRWRAMTPPDQRHLSDDAMRRLLETGRAGTFEKEYIRKDGSRVPVLLGLALLEAEPFRAIGFVLDLTERRDAERERERLLELERSARQAAELARARAEAATARLVMLTEAGPKLTASLDMDEIAGRLAEVAVSGFADFAIVWRVAPDGRASSDVAHRDASLRDALLRVGEAGPDLDDEQSLVAQAFSSHRSVVASPVEPSFAARVVPGIQAQQELRKLEPRSALFVPLSHRGTGLGVLMLARTDDAKPFDESDQLFAEQLASRAAQAFENARLYADRALIADTLQRSLLPPTLPEVPGVELSARYRPAGDGTQVGGDFYDVFSIGSNDWGITLGDVCGKGAPAAAIMALSRYTIRTAALSETRPSAILRTLNESLLRHEPDDRFCTAVFARLHTTHAGQRITVACGGHPLPLLLRVDGSVSSLGAHGTLLGAFSDVSLTDVFADLEPGDAVILFTDGLTEERSDGETFGEGRLVATAREVAGLSAERIANRLLDAVLRFRPGPPRDDIALLVVRVEP